MPFPIRKLIRIPGMDYRFVGPYFVTAVTSGRRCRFGEVRDGVMHRNRAGDLVLRAWEDLPRWNPWVTLDAVVVMPNHFHGILGLDGGGVEHPVPRPSLGGVMGRFKSTAGAAVNRDAGTLGATVWQRGYYEHIIRNERSWQAISDYILLNPANWDRDPERPR